MNTNHLHHTATAYDDLPAWFLRLTVPVYSGNLSISQMHFPLQWKTAVIFSIPKKAKPNKPADFRPISITPVLSRLLEQPPLFYSEPL